MQISQKKRQKSEGKCKNFEQADKKFLASLAEEKYRSSSKNQCPPLSELVPPSVPTPIKLVPPWVPPLPGGTISEKSVA